jgi:hypothetical protein
MRSEAAGLVQQKKKSMSFRRRRKNLVRVREQDRTEQRVARKILSRMERTAAEPGRKGDLDATYIPCGGIFA